jgi:radical SAM superfamily enzyme YgiQ (UPF0313 family)
MEQRSGKTLLLSSPVRPFGMRFGDAFSCGPNAVRQLTWAQDGFQSEDLMWHWGLDLIARNLRTPATVLQYPTLRQFVRELKRGYDYVGLSFNPSTFHKVRPMAAAVRKHAPRSKIILGGYGTVLPDEQLAPWCDHICREEGISFMRHLLNEPDDGFRHPVVAVDRRVLSVRTGERTGIIFSALGCPYGCDFCVTSHFWGKRHIQYLKTGEAVLKAMLDARREDPRITSFAIMDEDFLVDRRRACEFLECVRKAGEFLDIMVFSSVKSVSQFEPAEIAEMGISRIWIGFEALNATYPKLQGRPFGPLVAALREYGISVVASMIVGYDHQTRAIVDEELRALTAARPTAVQIMLLSPCVGTPAWDRLEEQRRIDPELRQDYRLHDGYSLLFRHPHMSRSETERLVGELYRREYKTLGPSLFRFIAVQLEGYKHLKGSANPALRKRADACLRRLRRGRMVLPLGLRFAPSGEARERIRTLHAELDQELGPSSTGQRLSAHLLTLLYLWTRMRFRRELFTQPAFMRIEYGHGWGAAP